MKHDNPTKPRRDRKGKTFTAHAPYNFVPLPEKIVTFETAKLPTHDCYHESYDDKNVVTGWIDCEIETCSPTYIRGMMTEAVFKEQGRNKADELKPEDKEARAPFFATSDKRIEGKLEPVIPGSSIRGMIRQLVEIIGYGRIRWVADQPKMYYRAVAASRDDPLREPYRQVIGPFARNVRAGYFLYDDENDRWYIMPARRTPTGESYLKVKDNFIRQQSVPSYIPLNSKNYRPQIHQISFDASVESGRRGKYTRLHSIGARGRFRVNGNLVCSGNMLESGDAGKIPSPRKNQLLMLLPDQRVSPIRVSSEVIEDYLQSLSPFQQEKLTDWSKNQGCLGHLKPVFYVLDKASKSVVAFGHSPNFRVPALMRKNGQWRATSPLDMVPDKHKNPTKPDIADAIFGWVEDEFSPPEARAGRVFFSDAKFVNAQDGIWMEMITPHILASPKASTFQHYLVQNKANGHDPDRKEQLAHYGSEQTGTQIRGFKHYWHQGSKLSLQATSKEKEHEKQLTRIIPIKPRVRFQCRIRFENLAQAELGALLWALKLPEGGGKAYRHKIGMAKPLGMGSIQLTPKLIITNRKTRYTQLFTTNEQWETSETSGNPQPYLLAFEKMMQEKGIVEEGRDFNQLERIQALLSMLEWEENPDDDWQEQTRYMEIEHQITKQQTVNEYKERPVLPQPKYFRRR